MFDIYFYFSYKSENKIQQSDTFIYVLIRKIIKTEIKFTFKYNAANFVNS